MTDSSRTEPAAAESPAAEAPLRFADLDLPAPVYRHHRLIRDAAGRKLSKSTRATSLRELRAAGLTPADIRRQLGFDDSPQSG